MASIDRVRAEQSLDDEIWYLAFQEARAKGEAAVARLMITPRSEIVAAFLARHPEWQRWRDRHIADGTAAQGAAELRAARTVPRPQPEASWLDHFMQPGVTARMRRETVEDALAPIIEHDPGAVAKPDARKTPASHQEIQAYVRANYPGGKIPHGAIKLIATKTGYSAETVRRAIGRKK